MSGIWKTRKMSRIICLCCVKWRYSIFYCFSIQCEKKNRVECEIKDWISQCRIVVAYLISILFYFTYLILFYIYIFICNIYIYIYVIHVYMYMLYIYNIYVYMYIYRFELTYQSCTVKNFTSSLVQRVKNFCML